MTLELKKKNSLKEEIKNFLIDWHQFPIDYWWREKYKVPFGSKQHREMNLIDMSIEYTEQVQVQKYLREVDLEPEDRDPRLVSMTQSEIDKDFEELDLSQFN